MDIPLNLKTQNQYKNTQWLKSILCSLLTSPQHCSLCMESNGDFYPLDKHLAIYDKEDSKPLRDVVDAIFNFHIEDLMPTSHICVQCTEKIIHCYTFIENTKKLHKIIENCVNDLQSKATDVNNELNEEKNYSAANVMIVVEYDRETYDLIDDLLSGQYAVLSDTAKILTKKEMSITSQKKLNSTTNVKTDEKDEAKMTVKTDSKEMIVAPTPRVIKHPRIKKVTKQKKHKKDSVTKDSSKINTEKDSLKTQKEKDSIKVTRTIETIPETIRVKHLENQCTVETRLEAIRVKGLENKMNKIKNQINKIRNEDRVVNKVKKRRKSAGKTPNVTLQDGKLLITPLATSGQLTPKFNTYSCNECLEIFTSYRNLKEHEKIKHNTVIYKCRMCRKAYNSQQYLDVHYKTTHSKSRCRFCSGLYDSDLNNPDNLNNHLIDEHNKQVYICKHCDIAYYSHDKLETHIKSAHVSTDVKYTNNKTQCIMCLRNFIDNELKTHKCKFACLDCPVLQKPCIHFNYLTSYREQVLSNATKIKCLDCDYTTKRKEHLITHVNREHLDYHPFTCDDCGTQFYTKLSLKTHIVSFHQDLKCEFCCNDLKSPKLLKSHRAICKSITRPFSCDKCVASFETSEELQRHVEVGHSEMVFPCALCKKEFHDELSLGEHHARVHSFIQYKKRRRFIECTLCDITFTNIRELVEHEKTHDDYEDFPCNVCPKTFPSLKKVYIHKQQHYSMRIRCEGCNKSVTDTFIAQHLVICPYYSGGKEKEFICEECGKSFRHESSLKMHKKIHLKAEPCRHCGKLIKPSTLKAHMDTKHVNIDEKANADSENDGNDSRTDVHKCPACEFVTKIKPVLENHINRIHLKIKPYVCPICTKSFCGKFRLKDHMKTHSNDSSCQCPECGKKMANKVCLKMHMRRHTGEHPYECNICFEKFRSSSIMKTHRMKKHQDKTISCPLCDNMFHMATEMRFHVKKVHWKKPERFNYKEIVPEKYHYLFQDRRFQKLGDESEEIIPLL